jgi:type III secretory pathway component EscS
MIVAPLPVIALVSGVLLVVFAVSLVLLRVVTTIGPIVIIPVIATRIQNRAQEYMISIVSRSIGLFILAGAILAPAARRII